MKVILGLGNPGLRYRATRHNIGFAVVKRLASLSSIKIKNKNYNCLLGSGAIGSEKVILALPMTFMNLSGEATAQLVRAAKIKFSDLLVILDDVNLPLGKIRIRSQGSDGGHKGLRSIINRLETQQFPRLRIGVGQPKDSSRGCGLAGYVLDKFQRQENKVVKEAVAEAVNCCRVWIEQGIRASMDSYNQKGE